MSELTSPAFEPPPAQKKSWYRSLRFWASAVTFLVVGAIVVAAWPSIVQAFYSLATVNVWILLLLIPVQLLSYYTTGETLFSFLRARGDLRGMHAASAMRMSLEFNFANHMLPSGGAAGIAYTTWKLQSLGVPASRGALAQLVRFAVTFVSFAILLVAATIWITTTGRATAGVLWAAGVVGVLAIAAVSFGVVLLRKRRTLHRFAGTVVRLANGAMRLVGMSKRFAPIAVIRLLDGMYVETREITAQPKALIPPFLWSFIVNLADAMLYFVALAAFGLVADPALVFIAYGLATVASMIIVTPNGTGGYEVALIATLVAGGLPFATVTAAVVLARVLLLIGTIVLGWGFYQHSIATVGKSQRTG